MLKVNISRRMKIKRRKLKKKNIMMNMRLVLTRVQVCKCILLCLKLRLQRIYNHRQVMKYAQVSLTSQLHLLYNRPKTPSNELILK